MTYDPTIRPRDHFTPGRGWLNDPNGLVVHEDEHHLFFQHRPDALTHGPMSWGHAVSADLVEWTELPIALAATPELDIWSGSVVHDADATSGLGASPLVAVFTGAHPGSSLQSQHLAHSDDRGRTWRHYAHNPVLDIGSTAFRDPKVFRHDGAWVMVVVLADERTVETYRSPDLLRWEHASSFGPAGSVVGVWECPDLVRAPIEGTDEWAHVLLVSVGAGAPAGGSGMQYFVGDFDGHTFVARQHARWLDHGADFYAAVSYADHPSREPVVQGWLSNWAYAEQVPATDHRGSMSLARALSLRRRDGELALVQRPVVRPGSTAYDVTDLTVTGTLVLPVRARSCRVVVELEPGPAGRFGLRVRVGDDEHTDVAVDVAAGTISVDRRASGVTDFHPDFGAIHTAPLPSADGVVRLEVVVDVASVEVFAGDGEVVLSEQVFPDPGSTGLAVFAEGSTARVRTIKVVE